MIVIISREYSNAVYERSRPEITSRKLVTTSKYSHMMQNFIPGDQSNDTLK